ADRTDCKSSQDSQEFPKHWRSWRGSNPAIRQTSAGSGGAFQLHRRARAHSVRQGSEELQRKLSRSPAYDRLRNCRHIRGPTAGLPVVKATRPRTLQTNPSKMREMSGTRGMRVCKRRPSAGEALEIGAWG